MVRRRELTDLGVSKCGRRCGEERKDSWDHEVALGLQPPTRGTCGGRWRASVGEDADPLGPASSEVPGQHLVETPAPSL